MPAFEFSWESTENPPGIEIKLKKLQKFLRSQEEVLLIHSWPDFESIREISGAARLRQLAEENETMAKELPQKNGYYLSSKALAELDEIQATGLGIPTALPFVFGVDTQHSFASRNFKINWTIYRINGDQVSPHRIKRTGAIIKVEDKNYRLPSPLFEIAESIDNFSNRETTNYDRALTALSEVITLIRDNSEEENRKKIREGDVLRGMRLYHACSMSLDVKGQGRNVAISPVLFNRYVTKKVAETGEVIDQDTKRMLSEAHEKVFNQELSKNGNIKRTYVLDKREHRYLFIDKSLRPALRLVRKIQRGSSEEREDFIRNPRGALRSYYLKDEQYYQLSKEARIIKDKEIERIFIETEQFSDRVYARGLWKRPKLPWLPREQNEWMPDNYVFEQDNKVIFIPKEDLEETIEILQDGLERGVLSVMVGPNRVRPDSNLIQALRELAPEPVVRPPPSRPPTSEPPRDPYVPLTKENFEFLEFIRKMPTRELDDDRETSPLIGEFRLKNYQDEGVQWLTASYRAGWPGVLLADDMGLGKTLQTLVFLKKLMDANNDIPRKPMLIVAPVGLLKNWEEEHNKFLVPPGLGALRKIYGHHIQNIRTQGGQDIVIRETALNYELMQEDNWILTSYETLRDYQTSFAKVQFSCIVFDEIQRAKNPRSLICHATKVLNTKFSIGLSGTPVENSLSDLWTIIDILAPGRLGKSKDAESSGKSLRSFMQYYSMENPKRLKDLANILLHKHKTADGKRIIPPIIRRHLKEKGFPRDLPAKTVHLIKETSADMPTRQKDVYSDIIDRHGRQEISMLQAIHAFRTVCLHPKHPKQIADIQDFINNSARISMTFKKLDEIHEKNERVLLFLIRRDMQRIMAEIIKQKYKMDHLPLIINGKVTGDARLRMVHQFQDNGEGFDVLIISPRAGGVGINLTTANHVIHLERWWNPAVEDQCTDRAYRIGQEKEVHVYLPVAKHSLYGEKSYDYILDRLLDKKRALAKNLFVPTGISEREFANEMNMNEGDSRVINVNDIDAMEPLHFESYTEKSIRKYVSDNITVNRTRETHDAGADLIIKNNTGNIVGIVQCKHTANIGLRSDDHAIQDLVRARTAYDNDEALLFAVTNAWKFSEQAQWRANAENIILICRDEILSVGEKIVNILRRH